MSCIKSIKVAKAGGQPEGFIKRDMRVKSNVYKATLDVVLAHVADFYEVMLTVMCEKYSIPVDEALVAVMESPQMKEMMLSPEFRGLTYVDEADMEKDAVKGVIKKLLGGEGKEGKPLSPPLSESLSSPGEGGGVTKKAAEETAPPKKRGRPKKIIVVDSDAGDD